MNEELLKLDGFDVAIIGVCMTWHGNMLVERIIYDGNKIGEILEKQSMEKEDVQEYIDYNIIGAYVGDATPIVMWPATAEQINERP